MLGLTLGIVVFLGVHSLTTFRERRTNLIERFGLGYSKASIRWWPWRRDRPLVVVDHKDHWHPPHTGQLHGLVEMDVPPSPMMQTATRASQRSLNA
jgi:hypothetical protein